MLNLKMTSDAVDSAAGVDSSSLKKGSTVKPDKLHEAAQQFEALMIGEMMKSVREGSDSGWLGSSGDDPSTGQAVEMAEQHFAKALAMGGGLGLAKMVEQKVEHESEARSKGQSSLRSQ